jgi:hypothetical protein
MGLYVHNPVLKHGCVKYKVRPKQKSYTSIPWGRLKHLLSTVSLPLDERKICCQKWYFTRNFRGQLKKSTQLPCGCSICHRTICLVPLITLQQVSIQVPGPQLNLFNQYRRRGSCGAVIIAIPSAGITHDKPLTEFSQRGYCGCSSGSIIVNVRDLSELPRL